MKLGGSEHTNEESALEALVEHLPVTASWTSGFLAALASGPDTIATATWVAAILGDATPDKATVSQLERLRGVAEETLRTTPERLLPETDRPASDVVEFCRGYLRGVALHGSWRQDVAARMLVLPFEETVHADADVGALRGLLGDALRTIHIHWHSKRPVTTAAKVGRNDPCSCGSGKKHKKCCLAA